MSSETLDRKQAPGDLAETRVVLRRGEGTEASCGSDSSPGQAIPRSIFILLSLSLILVSRGPLLSDASLLQNYKTQAAETGIQEL